MRTDALACLLLSLATLAVARPEYSIDVETIESMITEEDLKLFNSEQGLWFPDDEGRPVRATLEMPSGIIDWVVSMKSKVKFTLYTQENQKGESIFVDDVDALKKSNFNSSRQTKIITHGWVNSKHSKACTLIRDAYLKRENCNVITIDWSRFTLRPYLWAASHVLKVGKYVAEMIDFLGTNGNNLKTTTLIGHSLGAHVMGLAGYYAKGKVNYVVGLDPALPGFANAGPDRRISPDDALHVEIIHTNAGLLGYEQAIGKADFYPNGGEIQVGCLLDVLGICSHLRSFEYFAESITTEKGFYAKKCEVSQEVGAGKCTGDEATMGGVRPVLPFNGTYYLETEKSNPFAKGRA